MMLEMLDVNQSRILSDVGQMNRILNLCLWRNKHTGIINIHLREREEKRKKKQMHVIFHVAMVSLFRWWQRPCFLINFFFSAFGVGCDWMKRKEGKMNEGLQSCKILINRKWQKGCNLEWRKKKKAKQDKRENRVAVRCPCGERDREIYIKSFKKSSIRRELIHNLTMFIWQVHTVMWMF